MSNVQVPTADEIRAWPATVDVPTAGRAFGLGRDASYDLARLGEFPVRVLTLGKAKRVTRASLLVALGIPETVSSWAATKHDPSNGALSQVDDAASSPRSDARRSGEAA